MLVIFMTDNGVPISSAPPLPACDRVLLLAIL